MSEIPEVRNDQVNAALQHGVDFGGRRVFMHGDVGEETIGTAVRGIYLMADLSPDAPIELYVTSYGGDLDEAFALHDVTRTVACSIHTVALGKCMSAAPLLVACGHPGERYATENTTFMLHDASLGMAESSPANFLATAKCTAAMMDTYAALLERYSDKNKRHWKKLFASKIDHYFDAHQALEWGLIDHVWSEKD